jgi:hypothetical protein
VWWYNILYHTVYFLEFQRKTYIMSDQTGYLKLLLKDNIVHNSCSPRALVTVWSIHKEKLFVLRFVTPIPIKLSTHLRENIIWMQS